MGFQLLITLTPEEGIRRVNVQSSRADRLLATAYYLDLLDALDRLSTSAMGAWERRQRGFSDDLFREKFGDEEAHRG